MERYRQYLVKVSIPIGVAFDGELTKEQIDRALVENFLTHPAIQDCMIETIRETYLDNCIPMGPWTNENK